MLKEISLGKYCDTGSILHKTDPRIKTIMYLVYLIVIFMVSSYPAVIAVVAVTLIQLAVELQHRPGVLVLAVGK